MLSLTLVLAADSLHELVSREWHQGIVHVPLHITYANVSGATPSMLMPYAGTDPNVKLNTSL